MAKRKGICKNVDGCSKARKREIQETEESMFVCDECGAPLEPFYEPDMVDDVDMASASYDGGEEPNARVGLTLIFLVIGILSLLAILAFYLFEQRLAIREDGLSIAQSTIYSLRAGGIGSISNLPSLANILF